MTRRHDLTDAQWTVLEPPLPTARRPGRPPTWTKRQLIDGIRWRVRAGSPGRDIPHRYGSWAAAYALFRRWQRDGTWTKILTALQALADAAGRIVWDVSVDSTIARAHQHAAGARKRGICRRNHPVGFARNPPTTPLVADANRRKKGSKGGRPLRQTRRPVRSHRAHRRDQRMAVTCTVASSAQVGAVRWPVGAESSSVSGTAHCSVTTGKVRDAHSCAARTFAPSCWCTWQGAGSDRSTSSGDRV